MKPKRLPRLWCALQGLLPLGGCLGGPPGRESGLGHAAAAVGARFGGIAGGGADDVAARRDWRCGERIGPGPWADGVGGNQS